MSLQTDALQPTSPLLLENEASPSQTRLYQERACFYLPIHLPQIQPLKHSRSVLNETPTRVWGGLLRSHVSTDCFDAFSVLLTVGAVVI